MIHTADTRAARRDNVSISQTIVDTLLGGSGLRGVQNRQLDAQRLHVADELLHARPIGCDRASALPPKGGSRRRSAGPVEFPAIYIVQTLNTLG